MKTAINFFQSMLLPESVNVRHHLQLHPAITKTPFVVEPQQQVNVNFNSRFDLEVLREFNEIRSHKISSEIAKLVKEALNQCVTVKEYESEFSFRNLHGFTNSKAFMATNQKRASQPNIVEFGKLVNDIDRYKGLEGTALLEACKKHGEFRLEQGVRIITDSWHQRFYWSNSGGSHTMSMICRELHAQNTDWVLPATITEYVLNPLSLSKIQNKAEIFLIPTCRELTISPFEELPKFIDTYDMDEKLGTRLCHWPSYSSMQKYTLVVIDRSRPLSSAASKCLNQAVSDGFAMHLKDFFHTFLSTAPKH